MDKKDIEILVDLSMDCELRLKKGFSKIIVFGKEENYKMFRSFFNEKTRNKYDKMIEYSKTQPNPSKGLYIIDINYFL